ncbi:tetratricopeptide repeat protein [Acinetobacter rudis]|uniref:tetratricopeptide repeat protein n=1 Tax=Acinetobacter rudis TaxID=632955 RepID=UPI003342AA91
MTHKIFILFLLPLLLACSKHNEINLDVLKTCKDDSEKYVLNGYLLNDLFRCKRDKDALTLIKENEKVFKIQDYSVTGGVLLMNNYIEEAIYYLNIAIDGDDPIAYERLGEIYTYNYHYKNLEKAIELLNKSLGKGNYYAASLLSYIYLFEDGHIDLSKSIYYSDYAIKHGHNLGYYYKSIALAEQGYYELAMDNLNRIDEKEYSEYKDLALSKLHAYYKNYNGYNSKYSKDILENLIDTSSNKDRFSWLADFYMFDNEFKDEKKAYELYKKGADAGDWYSEGILINWPNKS